MKVDARQALRDLLQVLAQQQGVRDVAADGDSTFQAVGCSTIQARVAVRTAILLLGMRAERDVSALGDQFVAELIAGGPTLGEVSRELASALDARSPPLGPSTIGNTRSFVTSIRFATDRRAIHHSRLGVTFSGERADALSYGECVVSVPWRRMAGALPMGRWREPDPGRHYILSELTPLRQDSFCDRLRDALAARADRDAFVFVHGFNVKFEEAVCRSAQLALDLKTAGEPILYSWAARGEIKDYARDWESVRDTAFRFRQFLTDLAQSSGAERINILAHSMGGQAVCQAMRLLAEAGLDGARTRIGQVVLAAPDIGVASYRQAAPALVQTSSRVTLYASARDRALHLAQRLSGEPRAGQPLIVLPGIETIDASDVDAGFLRHGYFAQAKPILRDLGDLFAGKAAHERYGLERRASPAGDYFCIRN